MRQEPDDIGIGGKFVVTAVFQGDQKGGLDPQVFRDQIQVVAAIQTGFAQNVADAFGACFDARGFGFVLGSATTTGDSFHFRFLFKRAGSASGAGGCSYRWGS